MTPADLLAAATKARAAGAAVVITPDEADALAVALTAGDQVASRLRRYHLDWLGAAGEERSSLPCSRYPTCAVCVDLLEWRATRALGTLTVDLEPTTDRLVLRRCDPEEITDGGIVIPDNAQRPQNRGVVVAIGPKVRPLAFYPRPEATLWCNVIPGDEVVFDVNLVHEVTIDGETLVFANADGILAVVSY